MKAAVVPQRLDRHVQPDFVAELEAVGDRLRCAIDANPDSRNVVLLHALAKAPARQVHEVEPGASLLGSPGFLVNGHPHFGGVLGREAVEAERRQEAEDSSGNAAAGFGEAVLLCQNGTRQSVETSSNALDAAALAQAAELGAGHAVALELARSCDPRFAEEHRRAVAYPGLCHKSSVIV